MASRIEAEHPTKEQICKCAPTQEYDSEVIGRVWLSPRVRHRKFLRDCRLGREPPERLTGRLTKRVQIQHHEARQRRMDLELGSNKPTTPLSRKNRTYLAGLC